jgi:hypothetical protein
MEKVDFMKELYNLSHIKFGEDYDMFTGAGLEEFHAYSDYVARHFAENIDDLVACINDNFSQDDLDLLLYADIYKIARLSQSQAFIDAMRSVMNKSVFKDEVERWNVEIPIDEAEEEIRDNIPDEEFTADMLRAKLKVIAEKIDRYGCDSEPEELWEYADRACRRNLKSLVEYAETCTPWEYGEMRFAFDDMMREFDLPELNKIIERRDEELFAPGTWVFKEDYEDDD